MRVSATIEIERNGAVVPCTVDGEYISPDPGRHTFRGGDPGDPPGDAEVECIIATVDGQVIELAGQETDAAVDAICAQAALEAEDGIDFGDE